ncbi:hypothetical protein [Borrelia hermsii]|nr:hypothetical protein [Borrelia hermsii]
MKKFNILFWALFVVIVSCGEKDKLNMPRDKKRIVIRSTRVPEGGSSSGITTSSLLKQGKMPIDDLMHINDSDTPYEILVGEVRKFSASLQKLRTDFKQGGCSFNIPFKEFPQYFSFPDTYYDVYESLGYDVIFIEKLESILMTLIGEKNIDSQRVYQRRKDREVVKNVLNSLRKVAVVSRGGDGRRMHLNDYALGKLKELATEDEINNATLQLRALINLRENIIFQIKMHIGEASRANDRQIILAHLENIYHEEKGLNPLFNQIVRSLYVLKGLVKRIITN